MFEPSTGPAYSGWDWLKLLGVVAFQYHPDHSDSLWDERMFLQPECRAVSGTWGKGDLLAFPNFVTFRRNEVLGVVAFQYNPDHSDPLWDERMISFFLPPSCSFTFFLRKLTSSLWTLVFGFAEMSGCDIYGLFLTRGYLLNKVDLVNSMTTRFI